MLTDFLDKHGIEWSKTHKHSRQGWTQVFCPRCGSENFHCGIKDDLSRASCYRCGSFNVSSLLRLLTDANWQDIKQLVGDRVFIARDSETESQGVFTPPTNLKDITEIPAVHDYVRSRGFDPRYLSEIWHCKATGPISTYPFRLYIPIYLGRKAVSWTARAACGQEQRYQTAKPNEKTYDEKKLLFGNQFTKGTACVVEGPLSCIAVGRGAVATFGLAVTQTQVNLLANYYRRVLCFDSEAAAQERARKLADDLSVFPGETFVVTLDSEDPAEALKTEAGRRELRQLRNFTFGG